MTKAKPLDKYEVESLIEKIIDTDPSHLFPGQRKAWEGITNQIMKWRDTPNGVWLTPKQRAVITKAHWRSQRTSRLLQSPTYFDANEIFDVIANPAKSYR